MLIFNIIHKDKKSRARVGELHTPHGVVETPAFVPVGTQATVKSLTPEDLKEICVQILFGNTYHLHLRPGEDVVNSFGGLGKFMHWKGVTMTDSGGFQVFSLARKTKRNHTQKNAENEPHPDPLLIGEGKTFFFSSPLQGEDQGEGSGSLVKITEDGVVFKSHLDGSTHTFTPEISIAIQKKLGADIMLAFDQCSTYPISHGTAKADMERTHRWAVRSLEEVKRLQTSLRGTKSDEVTLSSDLVTLSSDEVISSGLPRDSIESLAMTRNQSLYGIIQGSIYQDLREFSAKFVVSQNFDGIAIGGVANGGDSKEEMLMVVDWCVPLLPDNKVRHLLGVGDVDDIFEIVERGIDTFDCVTPSRLGRVGHIFVHPPEGNLDNRFRYDIAKSTYAKDQRPLSKDCSCYVCKNYTRGYIQHLFRARELLAYRLATYHNIYFITNLVKEIRKSLLEGRFEKMKKEWVG